MADSYGQLGVLHTQCGRPAEGLRWTVCGFVIHAELRSPNARIALHWLGKQREQLGEPAFRAGLSEVVGEDGANAMVGLLDGGKMVGLLDGGKSEG